VIRGMRAEEAAIVSDLWNEMCEEADAAATDGWGHLSAKSLERIRDNLERTPAHPEALCLVVEEEGSLAGFVNASLSRHPVMLGVVGEIEELYVRARPDRREVELALVRRAIEWARAQGAGVIQSRVALDAPWTAGELEMWAGLGFEHDMGLVSLYPEETDC
jgi:hypothetical protein